MADRFYDEIIGNDVTEIERVKWPKKKWVARVMVQSRKIVTARS